MRPVSYFVPGEKSSPRLARAFAAGCGGEVRPHFRGLDAGPFAAFCSPPLWPLLRQAQTEGRDWYYADHGYFGRGGYFRITKNRYQADGRGPGAPDRFRHFGMPIQPWRRSGHHIVVCPNSAIYFHLHGMDAEQWIAETTAGVAAVTDRPIRLRWKTDVATRPLAADLREAWAVVVFSSTSALEALAAGVPIVTLAPWAATARMGLQTLAAIERPLYPDDRAPFFAALANEQWTLREIHDGAAWRRLQEREDPCAA